MEEDFLMDEEQDDVVDINAPKLLYLGPLGEKLKMLAQFSGNSQSGLMRKLLKEQYEKIPTALRPNFPEIAVKRKKKASQIVYLGQHRIEMLDILSMKIDVPKSHIVARLLDEEYKRWPDDFFSWE